VREYWLAALGALSSMPNTVDAWNTSVGSWRTTSSPSSRVDAITSRRCRVRTSWRPFLLYPERGVVVTCHSSKRGPRRSFSHHPDEDDPLYLKFVRGVPTLGHSEQLLL